MARFRTIFVILALFMLTGLAAGQLGPKEKGDFAPTDLQRVKIGEPAPDFTLETSEGQAVTLSEFRGKKSVVLVFYRGYW